MGRVMHRRTNNYHDLVPLDADRQEALRLRLDEQHRSTLEDIRSGALYLAAPPPRPKESLAPQERGPDLPRTPEKAPSALNASGSNSNGAGAPSATNRVSASAVGISSGEDSHDAAAIAFAPPVPGALKLELCNARAWLSGKQARLEIKVATPTGEPIPGAKVTAYVEGAVAPELFSAETDSAGHTQITFDMPKLAGAPIALVIEAACDYSESSSRTHARGKLRFVLRTKPRPV
jgi:hypothetical protein